MNSDVSSVANFLVGDLIRHSGIGQIYQNLTEVGKYNEKLLNDKTKDSAAVEEAPSWQFLPPVDIKDWGLGVWKDYARFIKVFNHNHYGHSDHVAAEKELREKYGNAYDLICDSFKHSAKIALFPEDIVNRILPPLIDLPSFDWHEWNVNDWEYYLRFLWDECTSPLSVNCDPILKYFFRKIQFHDRCSLSSEKLITSTYDVTKKIEELKKSCWEFAHFVNLTATASLAYEINKKKSNDSPTVSVISSGGSAANSSAAKSASAKDEADLKATYNYDPKKWNIADWHEFRHWDEERCSRTEVPQNPQYFIRYHFFKEIISATTQTEFQRKNEVSPQSYQLYQQRRVIRDKNLHYLRYHLLINLFGEQLDKIPKVTISNFSSKMLVGDSFASQDVEDIPFAICRVDVKGRQSVVFKMDSKRLDALDIQVHSYDRQISTVTYLKNNKPATILLFALSVAPDFISDVKDYLRYVTAWKKRCFEAIDSALTNDKLIRDIKRIVADFLFPETMNDAKVQHTLSVLCGPPLNYSELTISHLQDSEPQTAAAAAPARQPRQPCDLFGMFARVFKF